MKLHLAGAPNPPEAGKPQNSRISNRIILNGFSLRHSTFIIRYSLFKVSCSIKLAAPAASG